MAIDSETVSMRVMLAGEETDIDLASLQGLWTVSNTSGSRIRPTA